jgi:2-dehydropantoate 2-reductase
MVFHQRVVGRLHGALRVFERPLIERIGFIGLSSPRMSAGANLYSNASKEPTGESNEWPRDMKIPDEKKRIHILGLGNIGKLFTHSLAQISNLPSVTILTHHHNQPDEFRAAGGKITLSKNGIDHSISGLNMEVNGISDNSPIYNLILSTKTTNTFSALSSCKHRISPESTILFTQNGMGTIEQVMQEMFPDPATRPYCLAAVIRHGVYSNGPFSAVHASPGDMTLGLVPNGRVEKPDNEALLSFSRTNYLIETVLAAPELKASEVSSEELLHIQLEKLVANACINPLTAIFRIRNGQLLEDDRIWSIMLALVRECSAVILKYLSADSPDADPSIRERFGEERLMDTVKHIILKTAKNQSSMFQDVQAGKKTEIDSINIWILKQAQGLRIRAPTHKLVTKFVQQQKAIGVHDIPIYF